MQMVMIVSFQSMRALRAGETPMNKSGGEGLRRVLSVQSHVVHGYVGNKAATFPLQVLGYDVDVLNSVQFSNHTGYREYKGQVLDSSDLSLLIDGLRSNKLLSYSHMLTGYVGSKSFLEQVSEVVLELKKVNKMLIYVCDPVLGDNGEMYVPVELLAVYKERLLPLADIITPNQFEAELLTGVKIKSEADATQALDILLSMGTRTVILSSVEFHGNSKKLMLLAKNSQGESARVEMPKFDATFTGTGDLFAALILARGHEPLQTVCEKAVCTMHAVLKRTLDWALDLSEGEEPSPEQIELRLIQSKNDIEHPPSLSSLNDN